MRKHGHRKGSITNWGLLGVAQGWTVRVGGEVGEGFHGEKYQI